MVTDTVKEATRPTYSGRSIVRLVVASLFSILIILSSTLFALLSLGIDPEAVTVPRVTACASTLIGFLGLIAVQAGPRYYIATLIVTAIPGVLAICFLALGMLIAWTNGVHTFASSWGPIGNTFRMASPFFAPVIIACVSLAIHKRPNWVRALVTVCAVCLLYAVSLYTLVLLY
ncbi:hypothetical protein [Gulosibacter sediminis]|uniref:hypothetical protein n=1 Tax=Gulosibacter sediminis TaxID=1729695 RepID=UPI0024A96F22|nr:hypothetical protein [Gulosibacter sediminis]